ncbi:hypothetical protein MHB40_20595 [Lysinibacillus sp. FSL K6-0057]|uniref:hypothetical protein n=1 Tax=Lysinibacillus sp. FSL K6-0057 TaxID=2921411 RepID=UPI003159DD8C
MLKENNKFKTMMGNVEVNVDLNTANLYDIQIKKEFGEDEIVQDLTKQQAMDLIDTYQQKEIDLESEEKERELLLKAAITKHEIEEELERLASEKAIKEELDYQEGLNQKPFKLVPEVSVTEENTHLMEKTQDGFNKYTETAYGKFVHKQVKIGGEYE